MNYLKIIPLFVLLLTFGCKKNEVKTEPLQFIISSYHNHEGYDKKAYTLGLFTKDYYKSEANLVQTLLDKFAKMEGRVNNYIQKTKNE